MSEEPFFSCECGSTALAVSHKWTRKSSMEEVAFVDGQGHYTFDDPAELAQEEVDHEWIAYCGGCGHGVTVEWLEEGHVRLLRDSA